MFIQQIYTNCLAHAAYYIESGNVAAIIDPLRDTEPYLQLAKERGATIKYVMETHFHADFVSGHIDLAAKTGAEIVFGPGAAPGYPVKVAADGELIGLGKVTIKVLHTPGHTLESACYLLIDEHGKDYAVFSGDTLFVGDVGRPDLMSGNLGKEELAAMMYDSLNGKIKTLADDVIVYPGHGPGSACGKNIGTETYSTIGEQKHKNYALYTTDKDEFIRLLTADLPAPPPYFFVDAAINKSGYQPFETVVHQSMVALSAADVETAIEAGALVLDVRPAAAFGDGFIKGAINIGLNGDFAVWVGTLVDVRRPLVLVTDPGKEREAITRLGRVGYEQVRGYLDGGMEAWTAAGYVADKILTYTSDVFEKTIGSSDFILVDVRKDREVTGGMIIRAIHIPLNALQGRKHELNKNGNYLVYCAGGYRSMIAASLLKATGFMNVANIEGGINLVKKTVPSLVRF